jgi:uncharacterized membrane protein YbhN (UPF0104 family)
MRPAVLGVVSTSIAVGTLATLPHVGSRVTQGLAGVGSASPNWIAIAGCLFLAMYAAMSSAWRTALTACGSELSRREACARYGIGSLVNTFVPFRLGDAARIAAFGRALDADDGIWVAGGALATIEVARVLSIALLIALACCLGAVPVSWLALIVVILAPLGVILGYVVARCHGPHARLTRLLTAARELAKKPRYALRLLVAVETASATRVLAAMSICFALKVPSPSVAGLLIVVASELSGQLQLTPANIGIASGTVALALAARGVQLDKALAVGFALQAVETSVGVLFGVVGLIALARSYRSARRWFSIAVAAAACVALVTMASLESLGQFN